MNGATAAWQKKVARHSPLKEPVNIYEMHAGSWRTYEDGNPYNYRELAAQLVPYLAGDGLYPCGADAHYGTPV